jgi:hypothetical protein
MWHSAGEAVPDGDAAVAEYAIDPLDRVFRHQTVRVRQVLTDHRDGERGSAHDAQRGRNERIHQLGMEVVAVQGVNARADVLQPAATARGRHFHPRDASSSPDVSRSDRIAPIGARPAQLEIEGTREGHDHNQENMSAPNRGLKEEAWPT